MPTAPLIDPSELAERLGEPGLHIVDARFSLADPSAGERGYLAGHIPGAAFMDVARDLASPPGGADGGRHPLPSRESLERAARGAGITSAGAVVAYDEQGEGGAARLWWLLRRHGHARVAVLDGALRGWVEAGGALARGYERIEPGDFAAREPAAGETADAAEIERRLGDPALVLLDARARERYRGETEPLDPVAGHIPGARNVPFAELAPGGRFPAPAELRERLAGRHLPAEPLVAYCGSGVTACVLVLAAEAAGIAARLYPGSWSEWSSRGLPVERSA